MENSSEVRSYPRFSCQSLTATFPIQINTTKSSRNERQCCCDILSQSVDQHEKIQTHYEQWQQWEFQAAQYLSTLKENEISSINLSMWKSMDRTVETSTKKELYTLLNSFSQLVQTGIPNSMRGKFWWLCSGANIKKKDADDRLHQENKTIDASLSYYQYLQSELPNALSPTVASDIEKDLPRTFPPPASSKTSEKKSWHTSFNKDPRQNSALDRPTVALQLDISELRRVLQAYSLWNPDVGYCQSMNFLVAVLLLFLEEEEAFYVLTVMLDNLMPQYHSLFMVGSRAEQRVLLDLLRVHVPKVTCHLEALGVELEPFTLKWFLCGYLNTLPLDVVLRTWDVYFYEGSQIMLQMALVLFKVCEKSILECGEAIDVYGKLSTFPYELLTQETQKFRTGTIPSSQAYGLYSLIDALQAEIGLIEKSCHANSQDRCLCDTMIRLLNLESYIGSISIPSINECRRYYRSEIEMEVREYEKQRDARLLNHKNTNSNILVLSEDEKDDKEYDFIDEYTPAYERRKRILELFENEDTFIDAIELQFPTTLSSCDNSPHDLQ